MVSPTTRSGERTETIARVHRGVDPADTASARLRDTRMVEP
jgi:hypothetical protein